MDDSPLRPSQATQQGTTDRFSTALPSSSLLSDTCSHSNLEYNFADDPYWVATQLVTDPRRLGMPGSDLSVEDLADICCILHPLTPPASRAAALIHEDPSAHSGCTLVTGNNVEVHEKVATYTSEDTTFQLAAEGLTPCDLVLRLSATLKDPLSGFQFGRNASRCDFVIGRNQESKRISNIHFRIYVNEYNIIMLEDQSTNGTAVDGDRLCGKEKENGKSYRHTLSHGSLITLTMTPPEQDYQFLVRIPQRDPESEEAYREGLTDFFLRLANLRRHNEARVAAGGKPTREPLNLFPTQPGTPIQTLPAAKPVRIWKGGPKYNRLEMIGKGAFAVVYKITDKFDGIPYAAKELEKRRFMKNGILDQKVENEMKIMRKIKHPHVVQFIEHVDWEEYLYIIMEFVPNGDLGSLISREGHLQELDVKIMAKQLLSALKYLHEGGITHRDVKPDNILISTRNPLHVKLTDFGLSKMIDSEETFLRTFCGTLLYCAPEVYSEYREYDETGLRTLRGMDKRLLPPQRYGHAVDVWSTAGVLFYTLCGSPPFPVKNGTSYQELLNQIMTCHLDIRPLQRANVSENGIRFVKSMLIVRPEQRATIEQLEQRSWFRGGSSFEDSMEDEVDLVGAGDSYAESQIEQGASQLSINSEYEVDDSQEMIDENMSGLTEMQFPKIPSSFSTSDSNSNSIGNESYGFMQGVETPGNGNGRLFGEVNVSAIGSSGVIPMDHLNFPLRAANRQSTTLDLSQSRYSQPSPVHDRASFQSDPAASTKPTTMPPPETSNPPDAARHPEIEDRAARVSSLMGAESMVGQLNVHSPASAISPTADSPAPTTEDAPDANFSLRRPRENEEWDDDASWRPADLPVKRRKSTREIDIPVPPTIFWDPSDKSTHHNNYPRMTSMQLKSYQDYAKSKGETFKHGQKTFEATMQSFRSSRSPSLEPERAHSEPTKEEGRRMLMKRDERQLDEPATGRGMSQLPNAHEQVLPSVPPPIGTKDMSVQQPVAGNNFQAPKRILAKFASTSESSIATISLNITDSVFSWGRGNETTSQYANGQEDRIPKYAFKIVLFKPDYYKNKPAPLSNAHIWDEKDADMSFYIATKAYAGIWVNGFNVPPSPGRLDVKAKSLYWGELRHGDIVTIWHRDSPTNLQDYPMKKIQFRFECFWGKSREAREEPFRLLGEGAFLEELEEVCLIQEGAIIKDNHRRDVREQKSLEAGKLAEATKMMFESSFSGSPPSNN